MIRFECKKIFERRLNIIAMILGYIVISVCIFMLIKQESFWNVNTKTYVTGIDAFDMERQQAKEQTDIISDEYVTQFIKGIQDRGVDLEDGDAYAEVVRPMGHMFFFITMNYTEMNEPVMDYNQLNKVNLTDKAKFYEQRMKKIDDFLNLDYSFGNYKEIEKEYWTRKAENTNAPFRYGSIDVMECISTVIRAGIGLIFAIIICVSSVFSSEYETGAAYLIYTTKYGKNRLVWAKIAAATGFTIAYTTLGIITGVAVIGIILGFEGADLPIQLWNSVIPYNINFGEACVINFSIILLIGITITLVLLACSARLRSSFATLIIGAAIIFVPAFFPMSRTSGLWNHINYLFPINAFDLKKVLVSFVSYVIGGHVISYIVMIVIVYTGLSLVSLVILKTSSVGVK